MDLICVIINIVVLVGSIPRSGTGQTAKT